MANIVLFDFIGKMVWLIVVLSNSKPVANLKAIFGYTQLL